MYLLKFLCVLLPLISLLNNCKIPPESGVETDDITLFPFTLAGLFHIERLAIFMICSLQPNGRYIYVWDHSGYSPALAITELISTAPPTLRQLFLELEDTLLSSNFPNPDAVGAPLIPLVEKCSSPIRPCAKFRIQGRYDERLSPSDISSLFGCDELKPYMEKGVAKVWMSIY